MSIGTLNLPRSGYCAVALAVLLVMPFNMVFAAPGYDIPISELNKVKKKAPAKRVTKKSAIKKTNDADSREASPETNVPTESAGQTTTPPVEPNRTEQKKTIENKLQMAVESVPESETTRILHSPYSFVVAGRRTVIRAVIDSQSEIQEVNCSLRTADSGERTLVKMVLADGTQFTYIATLPGLSPKVSELDYTIYVIDTQGKVTRSQEFSTPLKRSAIVPSWQSEDAADPVSKKPVK